MFAKLLSAGAAYSLLAGIALGQTTAAQAAAPASSPTAKAWRAPGTVGSARVASSVSDGRPAAEPIPTTPREPIAKITSGPGTLPSDAGQQWRDYDISPYTLRVTSTNRPEQAIVDWILRETGYEAWHGEPVALLSANRRTLRVYHTPQVQKVVAEMVDRFVNSQAESNAFSLRVVTVSSPNWRARSQRMLHPVSAQSPGVQAWLLAKEDASLLLADLHRRTDFREHSSPQLLVNNGQSAVVSSTRPRNYVRDVALRGDVWPGFQPEVAQIDEGFSLELSPLLSLDGRSIDAVIKCNVDQVEKMIPVMLDVPTTVAPRQRTKIEVPQTNSCRLHERFRWPTDQVLLVSLGMVASPAPASNNPLALAIPLGGGNRADLLVMVESRGKLATPAPTATAPAARQASTFQGRY